MDKKEWMQKWFMEYRENKRWCIDTSKGPVSRLDVLKDKCLWTKPGFDMHPTGKLDKRLRHPRVSVTVTVDYLFTSCGEVQDGVLKRLVEDHLQGITNALNSDRHTKKVKFERVMVHYD